MLGNTRNCFPKRLAQTNVFKTDSGAGTNIDTFTGSFSEYITDTAGKASTDVSFNNSRYSATKAVANDFLTTRDGISGVSATRKLQTCSNSRRRIEASARMMTVMDNILDVLINQIGAKIAQ